MKPNRTTTSQYDAQDAGALRVLRIVLMWKLLRLDALARKPRVMDLMALTIRHYLGGKLAVITVKHERRWLHFLREFRRRKAVLVRRTGLYRDKLLGRL